MTISISADFRCIFLPEFCGTLQNSAKLGGNLRAFVFKFDQLRIAEPYKYQNYLLNITMCKRANVQNLFAIQKKVTSEFYRLPASASDTSVL